VRQGFHRRVERYYGIGNMQLIDFNAIQAQPLQAAFDSLAQVLRAGVVGPLVGSESIPSALGGDHKLPWIRCQCLGDQFFADVGTIRVRRVYEVDAQLNSAAQNSEGRSGVFGRPPDSIAGKTQCAEPNTANGQFTAEPYSSTQAGKRSLYFLFHIRPPKYFSQLTY